MATVERTDISTAESDDIPELQAGDHLTRDEFERRYMAMPHVNKAELIEGKVYMPSPVSVKNHGFPHACITGWLTYYCAQTQGLQVADNSTVRLDPTNVPQPDVILRVLPSFGGHSRDDGDYIGGGPELVVEISASTVSIDRHEKFTVYERNEIREYLIWRVLDKAFDWFALHGGRYEKLAPSSDGILKSEVFPGLWLDERSLLAKDMAAVFAVLQQGIASPEYAQFVDKLRAAANQGAS